MNPQRLCSTQSQGPKDPGAQGSTITSCTISNTRPCHCLRQGGERTEGLPSAVKHFGLTACWPELATWALIIVSVRELNSSHGPRSRDEWALQVCTPGKGWKSPVLLVQDNPYFLSSPGPSDLPHGQPYVWVGDYSCGLTHQWFVFHCVLLLQPLTDFISV